MKYVVEQLTAEYAQTEARDQIVLPDDGRAIVCQCFVDGVTTAAPLLRELSVGVTFIHPSLPKEIGAAPNIPPNVRHCM